MVIITSKDTSIQLNVLKLSLRFFVYYCASTETVAKVAI